MATMQHKEELKEKYDTHLKEKNLSRLEKQKDRESIGQGNVCTVYDLQAVMQCPVGESSSFYYISKLNCLNFTISELARTSKKNTNKEQNENIVQQNPEEDTTAEGKTVGAYGDVFNYFWDETQGKRGANEIGSCILDYLGKLSEKFPDTQLNIVFYSDNCCGQNKNKFIACLYSYAISHFPNIASITHKFLIRGHTQNEGDNVHSLIEKEIKRNLKSGPIYTSHQYVTLIKTAKKTGNPFKVLELTYDFFEDLKSLQDQWGYNFNEDDERKPVSWNDIKVLQFLKDEPFVFFYKSSYAQEEFMRVSMRNKRRKMPSLEEVSIRKAFTNKIPLGVNKKKGLAELLRKNLIPPFYMDYYKSLIED
ncbi:uncharacterized protein [Choristoneura fumiferana]|uniref:uncharacterized protein n=1 Tax=Choristoneura fumiferana TaxID=7141 RepID=UPI003D15900C